MGDARKIVLVEDETLNVVYMKLQLRYMGYELAAALATGEEAIEYAERERPALILIDINLRGDMNGLEAVRRIKEKADIPVVFLTGYPDASTRGQADALSPLAVLVKPVDLRELKRIIDSVMGGGSG